MNLRDEEILWESQQEDLYENWKRNNTDDYLEEVHQKMLKVAGDKYEWLVDSVYEKLDYDELEDAEDILLNEIERYETERYEK